MKECLDYVPMSHGHQALPLAHSSPAAQGLHWSRNMGNAPNTCTVVPDIDRSHRERLYWHHLNAIYLSQGRHQKSKSCLWGKDRGENVVISYSLLWLLSSPSYTCWFWVLFLMQIWLSLFCKQKDPNKVTQEIFPSKHIFFICVIFSMKGNRIIYLLKPEKQQTNS